MSLESLEFLGVPCLRKHTSLGIKHTQVQGSRGRAWAASDLQVGASPKGGGTLQKFEAYMGSIDGLEPQTAKP